MKINLLKHVGRLKVFFSLLILGVPILGFSINTAEDFPEEKLLIEVLDEISRDHQVYFTYDSDLIKGITVDYEKREGESVRSILARVLSEVSMDFKIFEERFVILYSKDEAGLKSLEQMISHMEEIVKDRKEAFANRRLPAVPRLQSDKWSDVNRKRLVLNVSGRVMDASGEPLIGVNVQVKGTNNGTATDIDGRFSFNDIDDQAVLVLSYIGYTAQEVPVEGKTSLTIIMQEDVQTLDEVVVVGYGAQKKVNLTGAISTVDLKSVEQRSLTNSSQVLQNISGVYSNQSTSQPGSDISTIRIRGIGTFNDNNPLVLVDGIEYNLRDVDPTDIKSVSVLKDASSAAIYGNRAANGVILITTKTGKKEDFKVNLNSYFGYQDVTFQPNMVSNSVTYMEARNMASINEGQPIVYPLEAIEAFRTGTDPYIYPNTDWNDVRYNLAPIQQHKLAFSGGSDKINFRVSLGFLDQESVITGYDAKKYSVMTKIEYNHTEKLTFGGMLNIVYWDSNEPAYDYRLQLNNFRMLPIHTNRLADGRYGDTWLTTPGQSIFNHPQAYAENGISNYKRQSILSNLYAKYQLPFNVTYNANIGIRPYNEKFHNHVQTVWTWNPLTNERQSRIAWITRDPSVTRNVTDNLNLTFNQTLDWNWKDNSSLHSLHALAGFSRESFYTSFLSAYIDGFVGNELSELSAGSGDRKVSGSSSKWELMSYFGRFNYTFQDKYILEANVRYDGSSRFGEGNRWGLFPSLSAGWRVSEESFFADNDLIDNLKIRGSWGRLGNQSIGLYRYAGNINNIGGPILGGESVGAFAVTSLTDPNITWETTTITDIGLELGLWENKFNLELDFFDKSTSGILENLIVPSQVGGLGGALSNLYGMSNKGVEIKLDYRNSIGNLNYSIGGQVSYIDNVIEDMNGETQYYTNDFGVVRINKEGSPFDSWYVLEAQGLFQSQDEIDNHAFQHTATSPGDIKYRDVNGDNVIDDKDKQILGRSIPKYTYGFNLHIEYKGFTLSSLFQGVSNVDILPIHNLSMPLYNGAGLTVDHLDYWTPDNRDAQYPRLFLPRRGTRINSMNSTFWMRDASYLKLKNIQLGYNLPSKLISLINVTKAMVYLNGEDLITFSEYKNTDPERTITLQTIEEHPSAKMVTFGINITL